MERVHPAVQLPDTSLGSHSIPLLDDEFDSDTEDALDYLDCDGLDLLRLRRAAEGESDSEPAEP
jgi:hypothetical protein